MTTTLFDISDYFKNGLSPNSRKRNEPFLAESIGAMPYEDAIQAVEQFTRIDTSTLGALSFPYPQLFVMSDVIIVCISTAIYEYNGSLTLKLGGLSAGSPWSAIDFKSYIYLTNNSVAVTKSTSTGAYAVDSSVPYGMCLCNFKHRIFIGSPAGIS